MSLEIVIGCMFSGKSSELIRRLKRHRAVADSVLVVNSARDVRNPSPVLQTHDGVTFDCVKTNDLFTLASTDAFDAATVIGIDEAQFFSRLREFVEYCLMRDKKVIVAGLDGDFRQAVFGEILTLIPIADRVDKLQALCMECRDGTFGPFTKRIVHHVAQELVGSDDLYMAVCRRHHNHN